MSGKPPSIRIIEAVADREGTRPSELSPPLATAIDPDALNQLFESTRTDESPRHCSVSFVYCGHEVSLYSDGRVAIE